MKKIFLTLLFILSLSVEALVIGTYNIRNFDYDQRYRIHTNKHELSAQLRSLGADIISVQEINNTTEFVRFINSSLPGYASVLSECGGEHGQRLGFVYNTRTVQMLSFHEDLSISVPGGQGSCHSGSRPMAIALFQNNRTRQRFYGISVHLKSGSRSSSIQKRIAQYRIIGGTIHELQSKTGIRDYFVGGDFNTTEYISKGRDYYELTQLASRLNMLDAAANLNCTSYWWGGTDDNIETPSVLDHLLISRSLIRNPSPGVYLGGHCQKVSCREAPVRDLGISYESVSDHCPIAANI